MNSLLVFSKAIKEERTEHAQALIGTFSVVQLVLLLFESINPGISTKTSIPAACLDFGAAIILLVLSSLEHTRNVAPSTLIATYLTFTLLFNIARVRTIFSLNSTGETGHLGPILATSTVLKFAILLSEAMSKRGILRTEYSNLPPEETSGPYSRSVFWWLNPLLWTGFSNPVKVDDLFAIDSALDSNALGTKFCRQWDQDARTFKYSLLKVTLTAVKLPLLIGAIPRLSLVGLKFAQPFLIQRTINYVGQKDNQPNHIGWALVGAYAIVYVGLALFGASSSHLINRVVVRIRGGLVSLIYRKALDLNIAQFERDAPLTLMSTDVERIAESMALFHDVWASAIELGLALYLLYTELGVGFLSPGICFAGAMVAMVVCSRLFPHYMKLWVECIETRVSFTSNMLNSMRSIKLLGISRTAGRLLQQLRERENILARKYRWLLAIRVVFQFSTSIIGPVATFAVYVIQANRGGEPLSTAKAFSILSILTLADAPLMLLVSSLPAVFASFSCFGRIQAFLLSPSRQDERLLLNHEQRPSPPPTAVLGREPGLEMNHLRLRTQSIGHNLMELNGCSFGWDSQHPIVHNIDMQLKRGSVLMVIGPTGCGKSTLIKGILGETPALSGFVSMASTSVALADQDPWIINSTIKDSICGESVYDEALYHEVLSCCSLRDDLSALPKGDQTIVGSAGLSLSGGQRQRVALARALFARKDILILDDVLSGLDADTEEKIFRTLFSPQGLLRRQRTSVVLVTHAVARLSYADWIVALRSDGTVAEQGPYRALRHTGGYIDQLAVDFKQVKPAEEPAPVEAPPVEVQEELEAIEQDDSVRKTGDWTTYKHYFGAAGWQSAVLTATWAFTFVGCVRAPSLLLNYFTGSQETSSNNTFMSILSGLAVISVCALTLLLWQLLLVMIPRASNRIHQQLLSVTLAAPLSHFTSTDSGTTLNFFSQDLTVIDNELPNAFIAVILQLVQVLVGAGLMAATAVYFVGAIPPVFAVILAIQAFYLRTSRQMRQLDLEAKAPLYTHFRETLCGLASIRAFEWTDQFSLKNHQLLDRSQRPYYLMFCIQRWLTVVLDLLVAGLAIILMVVIIALRDNIDAGLVGVGLVNVMAFNGNLTALIQMWTMLETSIGAIARVRGFLRNTASENRAQESVVPATGWPQTGGFEIHNFSASYSDSQEPVLREVSLNIKPGMKLGICGRSGSGKSSLLASILHLLEYQQGSIYLDGQDVSLVSREVLRQRINVISQDPYWIPSESVRFNLDPWSESIELREDAELVEVLSRCQVWEHVKARGGLDTTMDADFFSHGQRQLFCLARSMLRKSTVVILDEVSSRYVFPHDHRGGPLSAFPG